MLLLYFSLFYVFLPFWWIKVIKKFFFLKVLVFPALSSGSQGKISEGGISGPRWRRFGAEDVDRGVTELRRSHGCAASHTGVHERPRGRCPLDPPTWRSSMWDSCSGHEWTDGRLYRRLEDGSSQLQHDQSYVSVTTQLSSDNDGSNDWCESRITKSQTSDVWSTKRMRTTHIFGPGVP